MKIAAIDLGSNSFLCLIAKVSGGEIKEVLLDQAEIVRLGQGIDKNKSFHPDALKRADQCLARFVQQIEKVGAEKIVAVATSAARDATNRVAFEDILKKHKIPVEIISGQREAELTFLGATSTRTDKKGLAVLDIGGGSTEIVLQSNFGDFFSQSLQLGAVRATERWIPKQPLDEIELNKVIENISSQIKEYYDQSVASRSIQVKELIAVAGTPTTLAAMTLAEDFNAEKIEGFVLYKEVLSEWIKKLAPMSIDERRKITGLDFGRADIIVAGAIILISVLEVLGLDSTTVSTRGVRYGLAIKEAADA